GPAIPEGIGDEVDDDAMNEDSLEKLSARSASFPDDERCMTLASTYLDWGHGLHARAMNSQVYRYEVPCPHCGTYQELHFRGPNGSGVVWDKPETGDRWRSARAVELAERTAFYRCCNHACVQGPAGGRILGVHKPWMLAMGVWVARDPYNTDGDVEHVEVDDPGRVLATRSLSSAELGRRMLARRTYDQMRDASLADEQFGVSVVGGQGLPPRVAFEMGSVYSPFNGFGRLAGLWVGRGGRTDRTFSGHYLGTPHREPGDRLEPSMVAKLCTPIEEGGYPIGYAPPWALFLAMQADLQRDRAVITLRAYGARGERSGLVWVGEVPCALGADLVEIDPLRTLSVPIWQRTGEPPLPIGCVTVDSGDGQRAPEVWVWAKRWNAARDVTGLGPNARPCKGMSGKSEKPHDRSWVDPRAMNPRQMKHAGLLAKLGRFQVLRVNRDHYTAEVYRRVRGALAAGQDDGTLAAGGPAGLSAADAWVYPADWGEGEACSVTAACSAAQTMGAGRHFRELTAVEGRTVRHKQTQRERFEWVVIAGRDDHSLDAERYGLADVERRGIAQMEARPDLQAAGQRPRGSSAEPSRAARTGGTAPSERPYDA
ncbi:MAG: terminase gpA endonuclease subunit, partial [Planctomycetota bacterium]